MARDRLAAMRAQQQGGDSYGSAPTQNSNTQPRYNPYDQRGTTNAGSNNNNNYELSQVGSRDQLNGGNDFYDEIAGIQDEIRNFHYSIDQISNYQKQLLGKVEPTNSRTNQELDNLIDQTRSLSDQIKRRIQALQRQPVDARQAATRKPQIDLVRTNFMEAIQEYQAKEKDYRNGYKDRMARQFKIVNPNATPEEVNQVVNSEQSGPIFSQAVMGNRYQESSSAYKEVQTRHEEVQRIERTLVELAQLFSDMSVLVEQQNDTVNHIEATSGAVEKDTEAGLGYTDKAVVSSRAARKKRWICFFITLIILIIVGVAVGVEVSKNIHTSNTTTTSNATRLF